jgi:hypothetical protein
MNNNILYGFGGKRTLLFSQIKGFDRIILKQIFKFWQKAPKMGKTGANCSLEVGTLRLYIK